MMNVDVHELLGTPYRCEGTNPRDGGVDCLFASRFALERIFPDLEADEFPVTPSEEFVMRLRIRQGRTRWQKVGESAAAATKLGDVIQGRKPDGGAYVAVVVDQVKRMAISAMPERGVFLQPLKSFSGVELVLRRGRLA